MLIHTLLDRIDPVSLHETMVIKGAGARQGPGAAKYWQYAYSDIIVIYYRKAW